MRAIPNVEELVEVVETRNRLRMLQPWLEARISEGNTEAATHNAIGKIYVTINKDPQQFLLNNQFYDSKVVGKFCEKLDPYLAFLAYKRAWARATTSSSRSPTRTTSSRTKPGTASRGRIWTVGARARAENEYRRRIIDETVQTALPESKNPDEVSTTVKAFMTAELLNELIELLEKIVLHGSEFSNNKNLQNLLILTAIKADTTRVMDYIHKLDNFDGNDIAKIACSESYELFEEAFEIYKKFNNNVDAIDVLLNNIESIERASEFAERINESEVWSRLAKAQLDANMISESIKSYIKAEDPANYISVIRGGQSRGSSSRILSRSSRWRAAR